MNQPFTGAVAALALFVLPLRAATRDVWVEVRSPHFVVELLSEYWQRGHAHPAGIFSHRLNQFYVAIQLDAGGANPCSTIYHEYFHSITTPYFPELPAWLAEGLANFYGNTQITDVNAGMGMPDGRLVSQLVLIRLSQQDAICGRVRRGRPQSVGAC